MNEFQLLQDFRSEIPAPGPDSVRAARQALATRFAAREPWWRRRVVVAIAVVLAAAIGAGAALGLGDRLVDLIRGKPAPDSFQKMMAITHGQGVFGYQVDGEWRGVTAAPTALGPVGIWAAPTTNGGICWHAVIVDPKVTVVRGHLMGACGPRTLPAGMRPPVQAAPIRFEDRGRLPGAGSATGKQLDVILGRAGAGVTSVEVQLRGGQRRRLPVRESFFLAQLPLGSRVNCIVALDRASRPLGRVDPLPTFEGGC